MPIGLKHPGQVSADFAPSLYTIAELAYIIYTHMHTD